MQADASPRWLRRFATVALLYSVAVIAFGAYVRATGSGAGCGAHWPTCRGEITPRSPSLQTRIEFTHRLTSGLALPLVLVLAALATRAHAPHHRVRRAAWASVGLMVLEALIGALLVKKQWVAHDASLARALAHSAHLVNTFALLAAQTLVCAFAGGVGGMRFRRQGRLPLILFSTLAAVAVLGASGAVTALGDTLFPAQSLEAGVMQDFSSTAHFLIRLRVVHPVLALLVAVLGAFAVSSALALRPSASVTRAARVLGAAYAAQWVVGVTNLALLAPVGLQLLHLLLADAVWISLVWLSAAALANETTT